MTGRERILMAIDHKEPDRVPIDIGAMRSTGIAAIAYNNLKAHLGIDEGATRMYDFQQQLAYTGPEIAKAFHVDAIDAGQGFLRDDDQWKAWRLSDGSPCVIPDYLDVRTDENGTTFLHSNEHSGLRVGQKPPSSLYTDQAYWPWKDMDQIPEPIDADDLSKHMWAVPCPPFHLNFVDDKDDRETFVRGLEQLRKDSDQAIMLSIGHNLFEQGTFLRGIDNFLVDIYTDKQSVARLLDLLLERYMAKLETIVATAKDTVDIIQFGDDLGTQDGPWMAPEFVDELFVPRYREMWDYVHRNSDCKVFLHSCGSVYELLPSLIDAGLDILNPVQTTTRNMEPERLKREFGKDLTFWGGGSNTRDVLPRGTPAEVRDDVKRRVEIFSKDGGFVFNPIHNVLADVPPENVIAAFSAAYEFGTGSS